MILLNYAHPVTAEQQAQLAALGAAVAEVRDISTHVDRSRPLATIAAQLADATGFDGRAWQSEAFIVNPPGLAPLALALLAEIHGRCGYFPPVLNLRPVVDALPPRYEVAEIVNLQAQRDAARARRSL
jgi:hypothetical protein